MFLKMQIIGLPFQGIRLVIHNKSVFSHQKVILDDVWTEASNCAEVANAFKVYARKQRYSILLITQSFFENGRFGKTIRYRATLFRPPVKIFLATILIFLL